MIYTLTVITVMIKLRYKKIDGGNSIHKTKLEKGYKMKDRGKSIHETNNKKNQY